MKQVYLVYYSEGRKVAEPPMDRSYDFVQEFKPGQLISATTEEVCKKKIKMPNWASECKIIRIGWQTSKHKAYLWSRFKYECCNLSSEATEIEWLPFLPSVTKFTA